MKTKLTSYILFPPVLMLVFYSASASASRLEVDPNAPWFLYFGSLILLYAHIGGGAAGLLSGVVASLSKKGSNIHRAAGKVFLLSMFICYLIGAGVAPFLESQQSTNFVAAVLALYLLTTGVSAAKRKRFTAGKQEKIGFVIALLITSLGAVFMYLAYQSPNGSLDGSPPQAYILFVVAGGLATLGELNVLLRKELSPIARVSRHLWRMCMSFFIASGALFFGQAQFFPEWFNNSLLPIAFGFFPLIVMLIYIVKYAMKALIVDVKTQTD